MNAELTPGEQKMLEHAGENALQLGGLLSVPASVQNIHDAEKLAKQVLASIQYLKERIKEKPADITRRPGRD
jgi:phage shock protein A